MSVPLFDDPSEERLFRRSEEARQQGDWRQALELAVELLRLRLARAVAVWAAGDSVLVERVADFAVPLGLYDAANDLLAGLAGKNAAVGLDFAADYVQLKRLDVLLNDGRLCEGLQLLESLASRIGSLGEVPIESAALPRWESAVRWTTPEADRPLFFSRLYLGMGRWLAGNGQYGHAAVLLERGMAHAAPPASGVACRAWLPLRLGLAGVYLDQGRLDEAAATLAGLEHGLDERLDPGWLVSWLELSGQRHLWRGELGAALSCFERVTLLCARGGFPRAVVAALQNQARVLIQVNQIALAEELLDRAAVLAVQLGERTAQARIAWLFELAALRCESLLETIAVPASAYQLQHDKALAGAARTKPTRSATAASLLQLPRPAHFLSFFEERALAVQWQLSQGEVGQARRLLAELRETFGAIRSPLIQLRRHVLAGMVAYDEGDFVEAARIFAEVTEHLEQRGLRPELWQVLRFRAWCAARLEAPEEETASLVRRGRQLLDELAASLPAQGAAVFQLNKFTPQEQGLAQDVKELLREKEQVAASAWYIRPLRRWRWWGRLHEFQHRLDDSRRRLIQEEVGGIERGAATNSLLRRLWRQPKRTATVSFLALPDRTVVYRVERWKLDTYECGLTRLKLREFVARWHRTVARDGSSATLDGLAGELAEALCLPTLLDTLPRGIRHLELIPDDALHGFPFAALKYKERYLCETWSLRVGLARSPTPSVQQRGGGGALLVGVSRGAGPWPALANTLPETEHVRGWLRSQGVEPACLLDEEASREAVLAAWQKAGFVHAACHGAFRADRPNATGLVLIPAPGRIEVLSLHDFAEMDLSRLRHVTLSSCWGADNFVLPGRWIIGFAETLCRQGAGGVLANLWEVDDEVALAFTARFYEQCRHASSADALRQTQIACLAGTLLPHRDVSHPYFWSGYRLIGDGRQVAFF